MEDSRSGVDAHPGLPLNLARGRYLVLGSGNRLRIPESGCFSSSGYSIGAGEGVEARNCPAWGRDDGVRGQVRGAMTDAFRWSRVLPGFTCGRGLRLGPSCASHRCRRRLVMEMLASPAPSGLHRGAGAAVRAGRSAVLHGFISTSTSVSHRSSGPGHLSPIPIRQI